MSWRVDTPPAATTGNTERMRMLNMALERGTTDEVANDPLQAPGNESAQHEDYSDIWQEEASRSSESLDAPASPKVQDLFESNLIAPARGKLPRTWRRTSGHHFQYSDEAESPQQAEADEQNVAELSAANLRSTHTEEEVLHEQDTPSEASDDTGIFFQSNLPNIFSKRHSKELKRKKADKLDLTLLMNEGQSMAPESSPPVPNKKSSSGTKNNPFLDTPPRFNAHLSSPKKSSPLRMELRESDISSLSPSHLREESSLPLPQSSPFHTHVEGISAFSVASDQRQLQLEMADVTASSIRRVRNEADEYLDAYEPQERSLDYIEEVTEPSRTWHRNTTVMASSPPQMKMLSPTRKRRPLFGTPEGPTDVFEQGKEDEQRSNNSNTQLETPPESSPSQVPPISEDPSSRPTGLLTRMTSSLWSAVTKPTPPTTTAPTTTTTLLPHPLLAKITPLPKLEPWTKTHYKTLDRLYKVQYKHETVFCPSANPPTPLSQTNAALLQSFLDLTGKPYIGAKFSAWGYEMDLTPELIVLCALFMELLSLDSIAEYETLKGREIELGDCAPGRMGEKIQAEEVVRRLATVVLGEEVRRDEKMGVEIDRSVGLEVEWPGR